MRALLATPNLCPKPETSASMARRRLLAGIAAAPVAVATLPALAAVDPDADAPLFALSRRLKEIYQAVNKNLGRLADLTELLPSRGWTPAELTEHRIVGKCNEARWVSEREIADSDAADAPVRIKQKARETDDGTTWVMTITRTRRTPSDMEISAWHERCAARRALFDAKHSAYDAARIASGIDEIEDREERLWDEYFDILKLIASFSPTTIPGVLAKMRIFREAYPECFDQPQETMPGAVPVFLSALADFEQLVETTTT